MQYEPQERPIKREAMVTLDPQGIDLNADLFRETLLMMRVNLKSDD